jgi:hypothetical protein
VKPGAVVIDVGINRGDDGKLCGDVDFDAAGAARLLDHPRARRRRPHDHRVPAREHLERVRKARRRRRREVTSRVVPPVASPSLATDLYQLTMAAGYFHRGFAGHIATCELFVRRLPSARRFLVALGIDAALDYLEGLRFSEDDLRFLATVPALAGAMTPDFLRYLRDFRFTGDVSRPRAS